MTSLLIINKPDSASAFIRAYVKAAAERHSSRLLPVKPNPREYKSPAKMSDYCAEIYMTASPPLNFSQNAVALVCDLKKSSPGVVPNEMKSAWQALLRQFVQEGGLAGMDSLVDVCTQTLTIQLLSEISHKYFDLAPPRRQTDMLSSMFSSLMGGSTFDPNSSNTESQIKIRQLARPGLPELQKKPEQISGPTPSAAEADQLVDEEMD